MARRPKPRPGESGESVEALARLPDENPAPVLRMGAEGRLLYANPAARAVPGLVRDGAADPRLAARAAAVMVDGRPAEDDFRFGAEDYALSLVPVAGQSYANVYGRNVTAERAAARRLSEIAKFPLENPNPVMRADSDGKVIFANAVAYGLPGLIVAGEPPRFHDALAASVREAVRSGTPHDVEINSGDKIYFFLANPVASENYVNIYGREITAERQATAALLAAKNSLEERVRERTASVRLLENIVLAANSAESLESALQTALHEICRYTGWPVGHAYVVIDGEGIERLAPSGIWHVDTPARFAALRDATEAMRFGGGDDLPGRVLWQRQAVWIEDLDREPGFPRADFTSRAGLKSGMAFPILLNGEVVAVLEFFASATARLDAGILAALGNVGTQLGSVAERKRAEEALRRSQRDADQAHSRLVEAIEAVSEGFALFDRDERLVLCNSKFKELVYGTKQHLVQMDITFEEMLRTAVRHGLIQDAIGHEEAWLAERLERHRTMQTGLMLSREGLWLQIEEYRTGEGGFVALYSDVTELKVREHELRNLVEELGVARDEAVQANSAKSQFLANMSHELRTPLNAIIGYSELLSDQADDDGLDSYQPDLRKIQAAGRHLLGLINDILDLSKIEAGKTEIFIEDIDLSDLVTGVVDTITPLIDKNGNVLEVDRGGNLGHIHSDLTKVRQSLFNILSNAAKFTKDGRIALSIRREADHGNVIFTVADQGIGMTPEQVARVFEPFAQADASISRKFGGTGLGMAITREFCRMLGGDILCTSELGKGTTFTMRLPVDSRVPGARPEHEPEPVGADVSLPVDAPLVLVIDDDANVRNLLKRNLAAAGIRAVLAAGGPDGLQLVKELRPDAITLDVMMPGTDGWTVLSELKADPETADIPVIMVTIVEDRQLGFSLGASEYLPKPVDRARLIAVLRRYLGEKADRPVLIVDDDDEARQMIGRILDREGVTFAEAENGRVGLEKLARERPALILLDLMMPEMDGFEFVERVRANPDWQDIPIIVITAKMLTEEERARLNGRVADLYRKADNNIEDVITSLCKRLRLTARVGAAVAPGHG